MPDISQISYSRKDLLTLLIKDQNIHEGNWVLGVKFRFSALNIGTTEKNNDILPAGVVAVESVRIERVDEPSPFSLDASEINPKK